MEFDFVDEVLYVTALRAADVDDPVVSKAFVCGPTAQDRAVTKLQSHLHRLSSQHDIPELNSANFAFCTRAYPKMLIGDQRNTVRVNRELPESS